MNAKEREINKKEWFDYTFRRLKACHRTVNFVVGARGIGKTFGWKQDAVEQFLKDGSQFLYMRRYDKELTDVKARDLFFPYDLREKYKEHELVFRNGAYTIDGHTAGFPFALSTSASMKSIEYDKVASVCFDEFIIPNSSKIGYLQNEIFLFNEALVTIGRLRSPQFFLMSNSVSWSNPYFTRYKIKRPTAEQRAKEIILYKTYSLTLPNAERYLHKVEESPIGQFLMETDPDYFRYAFNNEIADEDMDFITERPANCRYFATIGLDGRRVGVWVDNAGLLYACDKVDPSSLFTFEFKSNDLKKARIQYRKGGMFERIKMAYLSDELFYTDQDIKGVISDLMRLIL